MTPHQLKSMLPTQVKLIFFKEYLEKQQVSNDDIIMETEDDTSKSKNVMFRPDGCDVNDMCFDVDEFRKMHNDYGPITLDAFASSNTNLCQRYCSDANPFLKHNVKGENLFYMSITIR